MLVELAMNFHLFLCEPPKHVAVTPALSLRDEGADFALAAFEVAVGEGMEGVLNLLTGDWSVAGCRFEGSREENTAMLVGCCVERVRGCWGVGEGFEQSGRGE
jgi:hypothetical protein